MSGNGQPRILTEKAGFCAGKAGAAAAKTLNPHTPLGYNAARFVRHFHLILRNIKT